jgi:hypothetical protein
VEREEEKVIEERNAEKIKNVVEEPENNCVLV